MLVLFRVLQGFNRESYVRKKVPGLVLSHAAFMARVQVWGSRGYGHEAYRLGFLLFSLWSLGLRGLDTG